MFAIWLAICLLWIEEWILVLIYIFWDYRLQMQCFLFWDDSDKLVLYGGAIRYEIVFNYYLLENTKTCCLYTQTD